MLKSVMFESKLIPTFRIMKASVRVDQWGPRCFHGNWSREAGLIRSQVHEGDALGCSLVGPTRGRDLGPDAELGLGNGRLQSVLSLHGGWSI